MIVYYMHTWLSLRTEDVIRLSRASVPKSIKLTFGYWKPRPFRKIGSCSLCGNEALWNVSHSSWHANCFCRYADLVLKIILLRVHEYCILIMYEKHCLVAGALVLWILQSFQCHHAFFDVPCAFGVGEVL